MTSTNALRRELRAAILTRDTKRADEVRIQLRKAGVSILDTRDRDDGVTEAANAERAVQHDLIQKRQA